jgi:DNA polymerase III delta subunit
MFLLIKKEGKTISPDAWNKLTFLAGSEPLILESELLKLITYIGDRKDISEKDVEEIASASSAATGWQLAEGLVWTETLSIPSASIDLAFLLGLLGQVRFYIQQGRQVGLCLQQKMTPEEIGKQIPQLKPAQFQKIASSLRYRKMAYFGEALSALYEVELLSKNSNFSPVFLFDLLAAKLTHLKKTYTR